MTHAKLAKRRHGTARTRLTPAERAFVDAYVGPCRFNATQSALRAGLALDAKSAATVGSKLTRRPRVARAIDRLAAKRVAGPREVLGELTDVATADWRDPSFGSQVSDSAGVTVVRINPGAKVKALEILSRIHGLDRDPLEAMVDRLTAHALTRLSRAEQASRSGDVVDAEVIEPPPPLRSGASPLRSAPPPPKLQAHSHVNATPNAPALAPMPRTRRRDPR